MSKSTTKERSVFVGNIPYDVTEEMLMNIFSEVGTVVSFRLVTDRETGKPKGYGFCEYSDGATALSAMRNLNGYDINGRQLRVDFADGGSGGGGGGGSGGQQDSSSSNTNAHSKYSTDNTMSLTGSEIIAAIDNAIAKMGPLKLYDLLQSFAVFSRESPQHAKIIFAAHPALSHALLQTFDMFDIAVKSEEGAADAVIAPTPPKKQRRSSPILKPSGADAGGILGSAPLPPPAGGLLSTPPRAAPAPIDPRRAAAVVAAPRDPRQRSTAPGPSVNGPVPVDPRKRGAASQPAAPAPRDPRVKSPVSAGGGSMAAIASLAKEMTAEQLAMLPADQRDMLMTYMQQHGIKL